MQRLHLVSGKNNKAPDDYVDFASSVPPSNSLSSRLLGPAFAVLSPILDLLLLDKLRRLDWLKEVPCDRKFRGIRLHCFDLTRHLHLFGYASVAKRSIPPGVQGSIGQRSSGMCNSHRKPC
jgi:hypothetical protein